MEINEHIKNNDNKNDLQDDMIDNKNYGKMVAKWFIKLFHDIFRQTVCKGIKWYETLVSKSLITGNGYRQCHNEDSDSLCASLLEFWI